MGAVNTCGECTLCCKLPGVADPELYKPVGEWCEHVNNVWPHGCKIYSLRPNTCKRFACSWLRHDFPAELRPDRVHMLIAGVSEPLRCVVVHVDPNYPLAIETDDGQTLLRLAASMFQYRDILLLLGKRRFLHAEDPARIKELGDKLQEAELMR